MLRNKKAASAARVRTVTTAMMVLCFLVAGGKLMAGALPLAEPRLAAAGVSCTFWRCGVDQNAVRLLPQEGGRPQLVADEAALNRVVDAPVGRGLIAAGAITKAAPSAWMFLALGFAFRAFGRRRILTEATNWLRKAAFGALAVVVLKPVADTLRASALSPVTTGVQQIHLWFEGGDFLWGVITAGTVVVAIWALEQAVKAERALRQIV